MLSKDGTLWCYLNSQKAWTFVVSKKKMKTKFFNAWINELLLLSSALSLMSTLLIFLSSNEDSFEALHKYLMY